MGLATPFAEDYPYYALIEISNNLWIFSDMSLISVTRSGIVINGTIDFKRIQWFSYSLI